VFIAVLLFVVLKSNFSGEKAFEYLVFVFIEPRFFNLRFRVPKVTKIAEIIMI